MRTRLLTAGRAMFNRAFSRLLAGSLALMLVMSALCIVSYNLALRMGSDHAVDRAMLRFESAVSSLNTMSDIVDRFTVDITDYIMSNNVLTTPEGARTYALFEAKKKLPQLSASGQMLMGYYVYLSVYDAIVAPKQGFINIENYYKDFFAVSQDETYESWRKNVIEIGKKNLYGSWESGDIILYSVPISKNTVNDDHTTIVYKLNAGAILDQLVAGDDSGRECAAIMDDCGRLLSVSEKNAALSEMLTGYRFTGSTGSGSLHAGGEEYLITYSTVDKLDAKLILLIPRANLVRDAKNSVQGLISALIWLLTLGVALILILWLSNTLPLAGIVSKADSDRAKKRGMHVIREMYENIENSKENLEKNLQEYRDGLRNACINRIVSGFSDPYSMEEMVKHANLTVNGSTFRAVLVKLLPEKDGDATDFTRMISAEVLQRCAPGLMFLQFEDMNLMSCLFTQDDRSDEEAKELFAAVYGALRECGIDAEFYVGQFADGIESIAASFSDAKWQMETSAHDRWLYTNEKSADDLRLSEIFTAEEEKKLSSSIMTGEEERADEILVGLYRRNFISANIGGIARQYLYCRLIGLLAVCGAQDEAQKIPDSVLHLEPKEFFAQIKEVIDEICEREKGLSSLRTQKTADDVKAYIEVNYADSNMSLNVLAFEFGITPNYLSGIFKKRFNMNFSQYLESVRLEKAYKYLQEGKLSIDEIAQKIGYTNSDSFRRAFKRTRGVSPSQVKYG